MRAREGSKVRVSQDAVRRIAPESAFWPGTSRQRMPITDDMYESISDPHAGEVGTVTLVDTDGLCDIEFANDDVDTYHESQLSPA